MDQQVTAEQLDITNLGPRLSAGPRTPLRGRSTFIPPKNRNASIDTYCRLVEKDVSLLLGKKKECKVANNLTKDQRMELNSIKKDKTLVIQSADKGGAIVIMDRVAYVGESNRQLSNTTFYKKLSHNPTLDFKLQIKNKLDLLLETEEITKPVTPVSTQDP